MKAEIECGVPDERKREGPKRAQVLRTVYARRVYARRVVEREGVSKFLTVRNLISPGGCRKASVHTAAFSHFRHIEPSSGWAGYRRGVETARCLAARGGEAGARAGLASAGCSADAPACGQAVGSRLARTNLDLGRAQWLPGNAGRMNGKAKGFRACFKISSGHVCGRDSG